MNNVETASFAQADLQGVAEAVLKLMGPQLESVLEEERESEAWIHEQMQDLETDLRWEQATALSPDLQAHGH